MRELSSQNPPLEAVSVAQSTTDPDDQHLLDPDPDMQTLQLSNTSAIDVWCNVKPWPAVVGRGWWLKATSITNFDIESMPLQGLNAIANGGTGTISIGKG